MWAISEASLSFESCCSSVPPLPIFPLPHDIFHDLLFPS
jgi:hypothetical protein